jgi:hypothetical protein
MFNTRFVVIVLAVQFIAFHIEAQLSHFVYLQTDNRQPFYIKYNNKIISSTTSGYLILSKLNDGTINFSLGFPQTNEPEQKFAITIDRTEKGYLIKNFNEKGWGLFDLQSAAITYAQTNAPQTNSNSTVITTTPPANDPFANMLSNVTQDSTVKTVTVKKEEKPVVVDTPKPAPVIAKVDTPKKEEVVVQSPPQEKKPEPVTTKEEKPAIDTPKVQEPILQEPVWVAPAKSVVQRIRRFDSREGSDLVFEVVENNGARDTIRLFIAADSSVTNTAAPEVKQEITEPKKDTILTTPLPQSELKILPEVKKEEVKQDTPVTKREEPKSEIKTEPVTKTPVIPNSNCKEEATEDDFLKLRKRMAAQNKEEAMVNEAKKVFKTKCFSTSQLRNLAVLFLTDEWRYRFYDVALPFVSDFSSFKSLGDTITDDYYKKRFQALLPNQ